MKPVNYKEEQKLTFQLASCKTNNTKPECDACSQNNLISKNKASKIAISDSHRWLSHLMINMLDKIEEKVLNTKAL